MNLWLEEMNEIVIEGDKAPRMTHYCDLLPDGTFSLERALCGAKIKNLHPEGTPVDCIVCVEMQAQIMEKWFK